MDRKRQNCENYYTTVLSRTDRVIIYYFLRVSDCGKEDGTRPLCFLLQIYYRLLCHCDRGEKTSLLIIDLYFQFCEVQIRSSQFLAITSPVQSQRMSDKSVTAILSQRVVHIFTKIPPWSCSFCLDISDCHPHIEVCNRHSVQARRDRGRRTRGRSENGCRQNPAKQFSSNP